MNNHPLLQYISITSKNLLWHFGNSGTLGIPEALKNSANEIYLQTKLSNEALYFLQVKTFLETLELDESDVAKFMLENPDHQRLGFEIFKILDNTSIEKQAQMLARIFQKYVKKQITKQQFDKFSYVIIRINTHLMHKIDNLFELYISRKNDPKQQKYPNNSINIQNPNMELLSFEFLEPTEEPFWGGEENEIYKSSKFIVTRVCPHLKNWF